MELQRKSPRLRNTVCATITLAWCCWSAASAAEPRNLELETREFKISVDGKQRGKCTMQMRRRDDGTDKINIDAGLSFNFVVYEYRYHSKGTEVWKDDRLLELDNASDFNGTKYSVKASSGSKGLHATVNGKKSQVEPDVWVTSYWRLPKYLVQTSAAAQQGVVPAGGNRTPGTKVPQAVSLLDSDKGRNLHGELTHVGDETITVAGKRKTCTHYRITGDVQVELWYDSSRRLVRQESIDDGHKTVLELARIAAE
jgi:hypothetical protein